MTDAKPKRTWSQRLAYASIVLTGISLFLILIAGPIQKTGVVPFAAGGIAFAIALLTIVSGLFFALIALIAGRKQVIDRKGLVLASLVLCAFVLGYCGYWMQKATGVPPIHDITTDLNDPPQFVDVVPLREADPNTANPPEYLGDEKNARTGKTTAEHQAESYPDIQTIQLSISPEEAIAIAEDVAKAMNWEIVSADAAAGRLEATATTGFFGFKDDVVVRFRNAEGGGADVDVRSKSRMGMGDVGTNAERVREFRDRLETAAVGG